MQLVSSYGGQRHYLSLELPDTVINRRIVEAKAKLIEADMAFDRLNPYPFLGVAGKLKKPKSVATDGLNDINPFSLQERDAIIQALERTMPNLEMNPGRCEKVEFEYIRHGTQTLIALLNVATEQIDQASVGDARTEADLDVHLKALLGPAPTAPKIHLVMDCLNTHQSESLVRLVAELEPEPIELGEKGKSGILASMATRSDFLQDPSHRLVVHFTPKQCSWLNQIEVWFSILVHKLLRRSSFTSQADLKAKILAFVDYFNRTLAKPFKWNYTGKPLVS